MAVISKVRLNGTAYSFLSIPIGGIIAFGGQTAPDGYAICDGAEMSRVDYKDLFDVIGIAYGGGDGVNTFNLPDLRETVPVGSGESDRDILNMTDHNHDIYEVGEFKDDQLQRHTHTAATFTTSGFDHGINNARVSQRSYTTNSGNAPARLGDSTHGKQLGVNYIIKIV